MARLHTSSGQRLHVILERAENASIVDGESLSVADTGLPQFGLTTGVADARQVQQIFRAAEANDTAAQIGRIDGSAEETSGAVQCRNDGISQRILITVVREGDALTTGCDRVVAVKLEDHRWRRR